MTPDLTDQPERSAPDEWVRNTNLFREWDAMKQEIMKHKWYESERAGCDIGWDRASVDWLVRHGHKRARPGSR